MNAARRGPMDFTASAEDQPINLCDKLLQGLCSGHALYPSDGCSAVDCGAGVKCGVKTTPEVCGARAPTVVSFSHSCIHGRVVRLSVKLRVAITSGGRGGGRGLYRLLGEVVGGSRPSLLRLCPHL